MSRWRRSWKSGIRKKTTRLGVTFDSWDVVVTPFPFTEVAGVKRRPALVLSPSEFNFTGYTLLAMITTAAGSIWTGDTQIDHRAARLRHECLVRMKLFTLDSRLVERKVGSL